MHHKNAPLISDYVIIVPVLIKLVRFGRIEPLQSEANHKRPGRDAMLHWGNTCCRLWGLHRIYYCWVPDLHASRTSPCNASEGNTIRCSDVGEETPWCAHWVQTERCGVQHVELGWRWLHERIKKPTTMLVPMNAISSR